MTNMLLLSTVMYFLTSLVGGMSDLWFKIPLCAAVVALMLGISIGMMRGIRNGIQNKKPEVGTPVRTRRTLGVRRNTSSRNTGKDVS